MERAKVNLHAAQKAQAAYANKKRRHATYNVGSMVYLSTQNLRLAYNLYNPSDKLQKRFTAPFKILERTSPVNYRLELPNHWKIHSVFHVSLLKPVHPSMHPNPPVRRPPPLLEEEDTYEVEALLAYHRHKTRNEDQYLVKWSSYLDTDNSWIPGSTLHFATTHADSRKLRKEDADDSAPRCGELLSC